MILRGVSQPKVKGELMGQNINVIDTTVNSYTNSFILQLPQLIQNAYGRELQVTTFVYNGTSTYKTKSFLTRFSVTKELLGKIH